MIATCVVQGGEPPTCFASAVADYLVLERVASPVDFDDMPDFEVRNCLHKVSNLTVPAFIPPNACVSLFCPLSYIPLYNYHLVASHLLVYRA